MGRISSIEKLPIELRQQLDQRLVETAFSDYVDHAAWLHAHGFEVSKSAIHRYAVTREEEIKQKFVRNEGLLTLTEIRLRCLEIAAQLDNGQDVSTLMRNADSLIEYVFQR